MWMVSKKNELDFNCVIVSEEMECNYPRYSVSLFYPYLEERYVYCAKGRDGWLWFCLRGRIGIVHTLPVCLRSAEDGDGGAVGFSPFSPGV